MKHREVVAEAIAEYINRGNFVRIYPSKTSNIYDRFFAA